MTILLIGVVLCCLAIGEPDTSTPYAPTMSEPVDEVEAWRRFHHLGDEIERARRIRQRAELQLHIITAELLAPPAPVVLIGRPPLRELARAA